MKDFKDKVAVITGAASGIGYGLAERAAGEGMKVVLADIEEGALEKAERGIKALGAETLAVKTDVSRAGDVKDLDLGRILSGNMNILIPPDDSWNSNNNYQHT